MYPYMYVHLLTLLACSTRSVSHSVHCWVGWTGKRHKWRHAYSCFHTSQARNVRQDMQTVGGSKVVFFFVFFAWDILWAGRYDMLTYTYRWKNGKFNLVICSLKPQTYVMVCSYWRNFLFRTFQNFEALTSFSQFWWYFLLYSLLKCPLRWLNTHSVAKQLTCEMGESSCKLQQNGRYA